MTNVIKLNPRHSKKNRIIRFTTLAIWFGVLPLVSNIYQSNKISKLELDNNNLRNQLINELDYNIKLDHEYADHLRSDEKSDHEKLNYDAAVQESFKELNKNEMHVVARFLNEVDFTCAKEAMVDQLQAELVRRAGDKEADKENSFWKVSKNNGFDLNSLLNPMPDKNDEYIYLKQKNNP